MMHELEQRSEIEQFRELLALSERAAAAATNLLNGFKQHRAARNSNQAFVLITLHHMNEKCLALAALGSANRLAAINVVARSIYETFADVCNLCKFDDYPAYMEWLSLDQQLTYLEGVQRHADPDFRTKYNEDAMKLHGYDLVEGIAKTRAELAALAVGLHQRYKHPKSGEVNNRGTHRFTLADETSNYNVVYRHLSSGAHGKLSAMLQGVFVENDFRWPPIETGERPLVAVDSVCGMLIDAYSRVAVKYGRSTEVYKKLADRKKQIFDRYSSRSIG